MSSNIQDKLINMLDEKWQGRCCLYCGCDCWIVSDKVFELREHTMSSLVRGIVQPLVPVTCENCGMTVFINPLIIDGIIEGDS